jgi:hypothetical protein
MNSAEGQWASRGQPDFRTSEPFCRVSRNDAARESFMKTLKYEEVYRSD